MYEKIKRIKEIFNKGASNEQELKGKGIFYSPQKEVNRYTLNFKDKKIEQEYFMLNRTQYTYQANIAIIMHLTILISDLVTIITSYEFENYQKQIVAVIVLILVDFFFIVVINLKKRHINWLYFLFQLVYITFVAYQLYDSDLSSQDHRTNDPFLRGITVSNFVILGIQGSNLILKSASFVYAIIIFFIAVYLKKEIQVSVVLRLSLAIILYIYTSYSTDKFYRFSFLNQKQIEQYNKMMNNQAPYCLISSRFNQKSDRIELIECNTRAQQEFSIKTDFDFDNFISQIYIRKKNKPNFIISNEQIEEQSKYENSLKGQIRVMIRQEIDKKRQQAQDMKQFQKQMISKAKNRIKNNTDLLKLKGQNNTIEELKENRLNNNVDSGSFTMNQGVDQDQDSSVKKFKLFNYDKDENQENLLTAKLSLFKWHSYYIIITIEKKKQQNLSLRETKYKPSYPQISQYSPQKQKTNSIYAQPNNQQDKQNPKIQLAMYTQIHSPNIINNQNENQNTISTSNNIQNISIFPIIGNNFSLMYQNNLPQSKEQQQQYIQQYQFQQQQQQQQQQQSDQTWNQFSSLQTSAATPQPFGINSNSQSALQNMCSLQDAQCKFNIELQKKEWFIQLFSESLKTTLQKLEELKDKFNFTRLKDLKIDPQSYLNSFIQEIQLQNANLLKAIKIKSNKQVLDLEKVQISQISKGLKKHFNPLFRENGLNLFIDQEFNEIITTDQFLLQQMLTNLITFSYRLQSNQNPQSDRYVAIKYSKNKQKEIIKIQIQMPLIDNHKFDQIQIKDLSLKTLLQDKVVHKNLFLELKISYMINQILNGKIQDDFISNQAKKIIPDGFAQNYNKMSQIIEMPEKEKQEIQNSICSPEQFSKQQQIYSPLNSPQNNIHLKQNNINSPTLNSQNSFGTNRSYSAQGNQFYSPTKKPNNFRKQSFESCQSGEISQNKYKKQVNQLNDSRVFLMNQQINNSLNSPSAQTPQTFQRFKSKKKSSYLLYKESQNDQNSIQKKMSLDIMDNTAEQKYEDDQMDIQSYKINYTHNNSEMKGGAKIFNRLSVGNDNSSLQKDNLIYNNNINQNNKNNSNFPSFFPNNLTVQNPYSSRVNISSIYNKPNLNQQNSKDFDNYYVQNPFQFTEQQISNDSATFKQGLQHQSLEKKRKNKIGIDPIQEKAKIERSSQSNKDLIQIKVKQNLLFITFSIQDHTNIYQSRKQIKNEISYNINLQQQQQDQFNSFQQDNIQNQNLDEISSNQSADNLFDDIDDSDDSIKRWVDQQQLKQKNNHNQELI